ncbi:hypothetical protein CANMA_002425 [Candida margitis]|uniref:uncharacterized protein n=1 Tax=Candida margitis TaxID=1775924 RepID=UPI002227F4EB|nr:uncharacterized protein CANMA_002425 [Candida margitis]KAI5968209.1 hypothetical protein CANMA_002425 [Candida margitis]
MSATATESHQNGAIGAHNQHSTQDSTPQQAKPEAPTNKTPNDKHHKFKKKLVRAQPNANALKFKAWLGGHIASVVFGTITFIFQAFWLPNVYYINSICYRLALFGSMVALTSTFSHKFGLHFLPPVATLLSHENFQYLILAVVWCFTFRSVFKILPYFLLSVLHLSKLKNVTAVIKHASTLSALIAYDELFLIVYLVLRTLFFRNASGYQLTLFLIFYWLRILYNKETGNLFSAIVDRLDGEMVKVKNPTVQRRWEKVREFVKVKQEHEHQDD